MPSWKRRATNSFTSPAPIGIPEGWARHTTTNGVGTVASGQFTAIGGGKLGSKTYHFLDIALGTTLPSEASGIQSHVLFTWGDGGRFYATRDPGC